MWAADPPWNDQIKILDLHSPPTATNINLHKIPFTVENYEKDGLLCTDLLIFDIFDSHSWENQAIYQASWKLVTKWPRNPPSGNSLHVSSILPHVFTFFNFYFPSFFGYFHVCLDVFPCSLFWVLRFSMWLVSWGTDVFILLFRY